MPHSQAGTGPGVELSDYVETEVQARLNKAGALELELSLTLPGLHLEARPIRSLRVMPASLYQTLQGIGSRGSIQTGFLTMDSTRRLLPIMEADPKVPHLSMVGLWVTGLSRGAKEAYIWATARHYLQTEILKEKVFTPQGGFLLVVFPKEGGEPEFLECRPCKDLSLSPPHVRLQGSLEVEGPSRRWSRR